MAKSTPKKAATKRAAPQPGVGRSEFKAFQKETRDGIGTILDTLERIGTMPMAASTGSPPPEVGGSTEEPGGPNGFLPPQYETIFQRYFDPEDGFTARISFPEVGEDGRESGGITFTIFVPEKFSNVTPAHRKLYKQDLRTRAVLPHNIAKGIEDWCKLVAQNLKYDRNIRTK